MRAEELINFGKKLKKVRTEKKLELKNIADETKININYLKNMEDGRFDFLPELYVRSFLKLYVKHLGEDVSTFLNEYDSIKTDEQQLKVTVITDEDLKNMKLPSQQHKLKDQISAVIEKIKPYLRQINFIWLAIGTFVVILVIYSLISRSNNQQIISAGSTGKSLIETQKMSKDSVTPSVYSDKIFNKTKDLDLELKAMKRTWLQISVDDSVANDHIFDKGMTFSWRAKEKFRIRIGNAAGVRLFLNGKDLGTLGESGEVVNIDLTQHGIQNNSL